jgi:2-polyprenyl-3-methyl-5-hydroxy-6-metoxy-1,4-benzoquinol methylase
MTPVNVQPVQPFTEERHLDLQSDLHVFVDTLVQGKRILDVGAGLGRSKERMTRNHVTTYEPSPYCRDYVDLCQPSLPTASRYDMVTAFEVLEHVDDDVGFLRSLDWIATHALFLTTPNWEILQCQSVHHYREYTHAEFAGLLAWIWPHAKISYGAYFKNAQGGWCEMLPIEAWLNARGLKHLALIEKG